MSDVTIPADAKLFAVNRRQTSNGEVVDLVTITEQGTETIAEAVRCAYSESQALVMASLS